MFTVTTSQLIDLFLLLGAGFALWKGGSAERVTAAVVIANVVIGQVALRFLPDLISLVRLCNDGLAALILLFVTIRFAAPWMGGVMLLFAAQFALHSFYIVNQRPFDYTSALVNNLNWCGITWCLILGSVMAWRRRMRNRAAAAATAAA